MWVPMSVNDEGDQLASIMPGDEGAPISAGMPREGGWVTVEMLREGRRLPAALLRAEQPPGVVFALGWLMAQLFDQKRRASVTEPTPPFNPATQLPLVADLAADPKLVFLAAELTELLRWFPALHRSLRPLTAQTNKKKAAVAAENLATAEAADETQAADVVHAEAAAARVAAAPFSETELLAAVSGLNQAVLDEFADDPERISAYQLGLSLSDLAWLPVIAAPGEDRRPAGRAPCSAFSRGPTSRRCTRC